MTNSKLIWTTDPEEAKRMRESASPAVSKDEDASKQPIRVVIDRKRSGGKSVTIASGFRLTAASLSQLATALKKKCGAGGAVRNGEIEVQGEHSAMVSAELVKRGYRVK